MLRFAADGVNKDHFNLYSSIIVANYCGFPIISCDLFIIAHTEKWSCKMLNLLTN